MNGKEIDTRVRTGKAVKWHGKYYTPWSWARYRTNIGEIITSVTVAVPGTKSMFTIKLEDIEDDE